jgi:hypothetical protein
MVTHQAGPLFILIFGFHLELLLCCLGSIVVFAAAVTVHPVLLARALPPPLLLLLFEKPPLCGFMRLPRPVPAQVSSRCRSCGRGYEGRE